ncbi:MAG: hypothetical protein KA371_21960 [Acidobacteria bacterium]|nr:hypothetical protein [Acidobacteriota bacterium]
MPSPAVLMRCLSLAGLMLLASTAARADVTRFDITSRALVGTSGYEKIIGTAHFAVNPRTAANSVSLCLAGEATVGAANPRFRTCTNVRVLA